MILVNQVKHPHVKATDAQRFIDWLLSSAGQKAIADYKIGGEQLFFCLLYKSDAADEGSSVDLGGRRFIKKKNNTHTPHTESHASTNKTRKTRKSR